MDRVSLGRFALLSTLLALHSGCAKKERKPLVYVEHGTTGGKGGAGNSSGGGGTAGTNGSAEGGTTADDGGEPGSNGAGTGDVGSETGGSGARGGASASGAASGDGGKGALGGTGANHGGTTGMGAQGAGASAGNATAGAAAATVPDDCEADEDCPGGECVEVLPDGFRSCRLPVPVIMGCSGSPEDECCAPDECATGSCYSSDWFPWFGPDRPPTFNLCTKDTCAGDSDCLNDGEVCVESGTLGHPIRQCVSALCHSDGDCTDFPGGRCVPMADECYGGYWGFACTYAGPGFCRTNADCSRDQPPFGVGESYCSIGSCQTVLAGTICE
jgi:hypothetical protein